VVTETVTIKVTGMSCDGCAASLDKRLSAENGVQSAQVSFADGAAMVEFDPTVVSRERLNEVVRETGFSPA